MNGHDIAIHFAVTSHGLGHLTRVLAVVTAIHEALPACSLCLSTTADGDWIRGQLGFDVDVRARDYEPGAAQRNCFEVDVAATLRAYTDFRKQYAARLDEECDFLRSRPFVAVISDIPALPVRAASEIGIPAIGVSNFTWDWILEPWCDEEHTPIVADLEADYAAGTYQFCLPFGPDRSSFPAWEPAPLLARRATKSAEEVRQLLGLSSQRVAVVCPGGWTADEWPPIHARPGDFQLVTTNDIPVTSDATCLRLGHVLPDRLTMPDLISAADVVLSKAGYGLASECVTHRVPYAMIDRPNFRESPYLVAEMKRTARCSTSSIEQFFSGDWEDALEGAITGGSEWTDVDMNAAGTIAKKILRLLSLPT